MGILKDAQETVDSRRGEYGQPSNNLDLISKFWEMYLMTRQESINRQQKRVATAPYLMDGEDVSMMMILMKVARHANKRKIDNLIDIAGYADCADECMEEDVLNEPT